MEYEEPTFDQQAVAYTLLQEMCEQRLEVVLVPAPEPMHCMHQVRVAVSRNPKWYRDAFAARGYIDCRRLRTAFARMCHGYPIRWTYDFLAMQLIDQRIEEDRSDDAKIQT